MSAPLICPAPAKLNLFLHVVGRRDDGYHLLQSAFRLLDWGDELRIAPRDDGLIERLGDVPGVPAGQDLAIRAARLLQAETGCGQGADIQVTKRLPMGGGLGGGSSDAATVLIALNKLWGTGLTRGELQALGLRLGADVPFFVFGRDAFAEGVGERLQAIPLAPARYVVVAPPVEIPTVEIFSSKSLTRDTPPIRIADFADRTIHSETRNDLQPVACELYPVVAKTLAWLENFGPARMTGSGACVFAPVADEAVAKCAIDACPSGWRVWQAVSLSHHPLYDWTTD